MMAKEMTTILPTNDDRNHVETVTFVDGQGIWQPCHELDPLTPFFKPRLIGFGDTVLLSSWLTRLMSLFPNDPKQTAFG